MNGSTRRTCAVLQPGYLPWLGFFEQILRADVFVLLDDVPYDKHGWRNRNRIKGPDGPQWLTVPVRVSGLNRPRINEVEIDETQQRWAGKHRQALHMHYAACAHSDWLLPDLVSILGQPWTRLVDLDIALINFLCVKLDLPAPQHRSSQLSLGAGRCERLIQICRQLDCTHYYSGAAARDYLDIPRFERAGISVEFQEYAHPTYPQRYGAFVSHLSVVDLLLNCGPGSRDVLAQRARCSVGA